jgi:peptide deformylase
MLYGSPVLRKVSKEASNDYEGLDALINNMFETMYKADGIGLAAPQIGLSLRIFVVDAAALKEDDPGLEDFKKAFINPVIVHEDGEDISINEGCLSIPQIREDVVRKQGIHVQYYDEDWKYHNEEYDGIKARIIQHEYDHLQGILFTDKVSPLNKKLLKSKLMDISKGKIEVDYKVQIPGKK